MKNFSIYKSEEITTIKDMGSPEDLFTIANTLPDKFKENREILTINTGNSKFGGKKLVRYLKNLNISKTDKKLLIGEVRQDIKNTVSAMLKRVWVYSIEKSPGYFSITKYSLKIIFNAFITGDTIQQRRIYKKVQGYIKRTSSQLAPKWTFISVAGFVLFSMGFILVPNNLKPRLPNKYFIYSSRPLTLGDSDAKLYAKDSRSQRINEVYKDYNCPLEGLGEILVMEADKNNIPWWVVAAISFQESSCGKMTPEVSGVESYNAWGWGVWGDNIYVFDNWVRGIEQVSEYLNEKFYSKKIDDLCVIMKTYTPPSDGSWCSGVKQFGREILEYKTPLE
jgi:hypothetical protein